MRWLHGTIVLSCVVLLAGDWPQWLGPNRDAASPETVAAWKEPLRVLWRQPAGEGHSSPIVAAGRVYFHSKAERKDSEEVTALDAITGKGAWKSCYPRAAFASIFGNGPRATPTFANGKLFTLGVTGILTCYDASDGTEVWQVDTLKKFQTPNLLFGVSCSPLVCDGRVLVNVGGKGASIVAFDKDSGAVEWQALDDKASYASPIVVGDNANRQVIFFTHDGLVWLRPENADVICRFPLVDSLSESSSTPIQVAGTVIASSITKGTYALRIETIDGKATVKQVWQIPELTCYFSTPVAIGLDHIYVVTGTKPPSLRTQADLHCIETKTGKVLWTKAKVGKYHASLLRTGDNKLLMLEEAGDLVLLDANPKEYRELARAKVCGETWAHPALADGRLYVRDKNELICVELPR